MAFDLAQLWANPEFKNFAGNALSDLGTGLSGGRNFQEGIQLATQATAKMAPYRAAEAAKRQELEQEKAAINKTVAYLRSQPGGAQFADAIENGGVDGSAAFKAWFDASRPQTPDYPAEYDLYKLTQTDPGFGEFMNKGETPTAPSGYQYVNGQLAPIPGGPADPANPLNARRTVGGAPSPTIAKEIFEADEGAQAGHNVMTALDRAMQLNDAAWDGPFADVRSGAAALFGNEDAVKTQELQNTVTANALESLRATFGGNPTEGERKILLDVQGSVNQPRAVRKAIFERAKAAAERRLKFNEERARALRGGEYFDEGYSPVGGGPDPLSAADALLNSGKY